MLDQINSICSTTNAIKKSERKYFSYSHVANLMCFFLNSQTVSFDAVKEQFERFFEDAKEAGYFVGGFLASIESQDFEKSYSDKVRQIAECALGKKIGLETFRHATFHLALQNAVKASKSKIESQKFEALDTLCQGITSSKNLAKYFEEIIVDDGVNTSLDVPFFREACRNIVNRSSDKSLPKLFKFFQSTTVLVAKDKFHRQKRSFHLVNMFREFLFVVPVSTLLALDVDSVLAQSGKTEKDAVSVADLFVDLLDFWIKQFSNKNLESKKGAVSLDHVLADKVKGQESETGSRLAILLLKSMKCSPTNSLRGGELRLMNTLLGVLYRDPQAFKVYFGFLNDSLKKSQRVGEMNFYLNEMEHLGQVSLSAKQHKEMDQEKEIGLRGKILKILIDIFINCESEKNFDEFLGKQAATEWNEQDLSFKKFRTKSLERILNLVFKREDPGLLSKAAEMFSNQASSKKEEFKVFFKLVLDSASKINKSRPKLADLLRSLIFQNIFEEDLSRNSEVVEDITLACQNMLQSSGKKESGSQILT